MGTIKQLIESSMREILVLSEAEEASADMINDGKTILQDLLKSWSEEGLMVPYSTLESYTLNITKSAYTWGAGQDIATTAPIEVAAVSFNLGSYQNPLERMDGRAYLNIPNLSVIGEPKFFWYDLQLVPVLRLDCIPYGGVIKILSHKAISTTFVLTDATTFPDSYNRMLRTNLAVEFCPSYDKTATQELLALARSSRQIVKRRNMKPTPSMRLNDMPTVRPGIQLSYRTS